MKSLVLQISMQRSLFLLCLVVAFPVRAQISAQIYLDGQLKEERVFEDSTKLVTHYTKLVFRLVSDGYYFAGLDSAKHEQERAFLYLHQGRKIKARLNGDRDKHLLGSLNKQIERFSNNGYPFASIMIDSVELLEGQLNVLSIVGKGPLVKNDSAFFYQDLKTNPSFLYQSLDHVPGKLYSQKNYQALGRKMSRISFLSLKRPVDISFQDGLAKIYLDIEESRSNSFKGVLGLQQQNESSNLIGNISLDIKNLFQSGKELRLDWERFAENSQELLLYYKHPFFLSSKLAPSFQFEILRQDSIFLTRSSSLGVSTFFSAKAEIGFSYQRRRGTLLSTDIELISEGGLADFTTDNYQIRIENSDFSLFNQFKNHMAWFASIGVGQKQIDRNLSLADSFYDTLELSSDIFNLEVAIGRQLRLFRRITFYQYLGAGLIENDELLNNERFRLGGLNSFRGFNEKFFFADQYLISRSEIRSFFEKGSYLYLFYDLLLLENEGVSEEPFGTGLGFSLETSSGQFSFAMALGKSANQLFDLSNLKIHFGYLTRF